MPMKKVIAIAFSDLHIHDWSKFNQENQRTKNHFKVLSLIHEVCKKYNCPALFCGDLFHKPENITQDLLNTVFEEFNKMEGIDFTIHAISGNHDVTKVTKVGEKPMSWISILNRKYGFLNCIDSSRVTIHDDIDVIGVPYIDHNLGINEYLKNLTLEDGRKYILLLHTDYPGAKDTDGSEVGTSENLNLNILNRFDLILCGHIHKPQRLSKKTFMIGAPIQQRRTDKDCDMGYWKVYDDLSMVFVPISQDFPKFIDVSSPEEVQDDGNYYTVISKKVVATENQVNHITKKLSKKRMVRRYLKANGIADKKKESILLDIIKESEND